MKTINLCTLVIVLLWASILRAQPEINQAEKYDVGTTSSFFSIDTGTISSGASGANVTWDFTQVTATSQNYGEQYILPSQTEWADSFTTATLTRKANDGTMYFLREENNKVLMEGLWLDRSKILLQFNKPQQILTRPLHYNDGYLSTAYYTYSYQSIKYRGGGAYQYKVDGYGDLKLQNGTYPNVLRVKFESDYYDTMLSNPNIVFRTFTTSYYWYNPYNSAPIVQLSSVEVSSPNFSTINKYAYILKNPSTAIQKISSSEDEISAWINDDDLFIKGLSEGTNGEVVVYDAMGRQVANGDLKFIDGRYSVKLTAQLSKGIYIVNVASPQGYKTIKIATL